MESEGRWEDEEGKWREGGKGRKDKGEEKGGEGGE